MKLIVNKTELGWLLDNCPDVVESSTPIETPSGKYFEIQFNESVTPSHILHFGKRMGIDEMSNLLKSNL